MRIFLQGREATDGQQPVTLWLADTVANIPSYAQGAREGHTCIVLDGQLLYHYRVNTFGWTLENDPNLVGDIDAEDVIGLDAFISTSILDELDTKADLVHPHVISDVTSLQTTLDGKAASVHTHAAGDVTSGVFNHARLGSGGGGAVKFLREDSTFQTVSASAAWGSITGTLSDQADLQEALDTLVPNAHGPSHHNGGGDEISVAGLSGLLADGQTPLAHKISHESGGADALTLAQAQVTNLVSDLAGKLAIGLAELLVNKNAALGYAGLSASSKLTGSQQTYGSAVNTACEGNDARLSDARTPLTHDIITAHNGFPGGTSTFLRADGAFAAAGGSGADPPEGSYAPGSYTIATGKFRIALKRQQFTGSQRLALQGTSRLAIIGRSR